MRFFNHGTRCLFYTLILSLGIIHFTVTAGYGEGAMDLNADVARFQNVEGDAYLEIYYSLSLSGLSFVSGETGRQAQVLMNLVIFKDDSLWASKAWKIERSAGDSSQAEQQEIVDMFRYLIEVPAAYRIALYARDLNSDGRVDSVKIEKTFTSFSDNEVEVSDVQLASRIKRMGEGDADSIFEKRNYAVIPNPRQLFGEGLPILFYYFEAYNLSNNIAEDRYERLAYLKDMNGEVVQGLGSMSRTRVKSHDLGVEMGSINLTKVPSGKYFFVYGIADTLQTVLAEMEKEVFVYNPSVPVPIADLETRSGIPPDLLAGLQQKTEEELDQEYAYMRYFSDQSEVEFYASLENAEAKMQFIGEVWVKQARNAGMTPSAYRTLYLTRIDQAKKQFKSLREGEGWKTDQGRVFVLYGPPDNVERVSSSSSNKPYQIWHYDSLKGQGGVKFVFADRFGFRRYELIHSDLRGELQDPNWERFVTTGGILDR